MWQSPDESAYDQNAQRAVDSDQKGSGLSGNTGNIVIRYNAFMRLATGETRDISDSQYRMLSEFRYQIRNFIRFSEEVARDSGLEPQQHQLLLALKGLPTGVRPTITALSGRLCLRHHTTVELVNRLGERGAVMRSHSEEDRREVLIEITEIGEELLRRLSDSHWEELKKQGPALATALDELLAHSESAEEER
jgi:DNA-binding MarR family transcriptional regulator